MRTAELGYNKDQVIIVPSVQPVSVQFESFADELKQHNNILHVTGMEDILGVNHNTRQMFIEGFGEEEFYYYPTFMVRHEFLDVFDIEVAEGRGFSRDFPADTMHSIMINESMVKDMGWTNESAIGKRFRSDGDEKVIGVFKDFHAMSLHKPVTNFILDMIANPQAAAGLTRYIAIRVNTDNYKPVLAYIEETWTKFAPTRPFEYFFFDERLDSMYKDEQKLSRISIIITVLAIIIATLGLVGLTSFMVEQRLKEICVRRVHGATFSHVNSLLSKEFLRLITVAILFSWPLAYLGLNSWLQNFSQHIALQWLVFLLSGITAFVLVITITSLHANRVVSLNPADVLKFE
jgi:putative ABC transport system permease protein